MRPPKVKEIGSWLWHGLNAASVAHWLWSIGGGGAITTFLSAILGLPSPWSILFAISVFLLAFATILMWLSGQPLRQPLADSSRGGDRNHAGGIASTADDPRPKDSQASHQTAASKTQSSEGRVLSRVLQRRLDEGMRLRKDLPAMPGLFSLDQPATTQADVENWIRRTKVLLEPKPKLLAEFNYQRPAALLDRLMGTNPLEPAYIKALDQRIANLNGIIIQLREQGR